MAANTVMVRLDTLPQDVVNAILAAAESPNLPAASSTNNGKILGIKSGKWAIVAAPAGLPAVTAEDNGKVLKVVDGVWAAVSEAVSESET